MSEIENIAIISGIIAAKKTSELIPLCHNIVIENKTYSPEQRERILKYCLADVELTEKVFLKQIADIEHKNKLKTET